VVLAARVQTRPVLSALFPLKQLSRSTERVIVIAAAAAWEELPKTGLLCMN
jgi:hypothetical protein